MSGTNSTGVTGSITLEDVLRSQRNLQAQLDMLPKPAVPLRIYQNALCMRNTDEPDSGFKRKPWMRETYYLRVRKKHIKRFGYRTEPAAYIVNAETMKGVVCHPALYEKMKNELMAEGIPKPSRENFMRWMVP